MDQALSRLMRSMGAKVNASMYGGGEPGDEATKSTHSGAGHSHL